MNYQAIIDLVKQASNAVFDESLKTDVAMKGAADFVTAVDLKISDFLKRELAILTPDVGFMSEEESGAIAERRWILDPIDGTTNLVYGYNMSSVSLALCEYGEITFGVVYNPYSKELFVAERGKGATLNGNKLPTIADRELSDCIIEFGAGSTKKQYTESSFAIAKEVFTHCLDLRRICSSALAICFVAAGRINGYFERVIKPWDYAAASLILHECGGLSTDWDGNAVEFENASSFACGSPKAHAFLLDTVKKHC